MPGFYAQSKLKPFSYNVVLAHTFRCVTNVSTQMNCSLQVGIPRHEGPAGLPVKFN